MTTRLNFNSPTILGNIDTAVNPTDVVNKTYVDAIPSGTPAGDIATISSTSSIISIGNSGTVYTVDFATPSVDGYLGYNTTTNRIEHIPYTYGNIINVDAYVLDTNYSGFNVVVPFNLNIISPTYLFGSMNNGVYTFNRNMLVEINLAIECSSPTTSLQDVYGGGVLNGNFAGSQRICAIELHGSYNFKFSTSEIIQVNVGDNFSWRIEVNAQNLFNSIYLSTITFTALN